jgi:prepilin peptidase CpaA
LAELVWIGYDRWKQRIESRFGVIGVASWGFWIFVVAVAVYVATAGYTDLRMRRIPNYLTVPTAVAALLCALLQSFLPDYPTSVWDCLLGFALGFGLFFIPVLFGGGGAGDLKLVAALGACLGWFWLIASLVLSLTFALIAALIVWSISFSARGLRLRRAKQPDATAANKKSAKAKSPRRRSVPFAIPVALGTWCILGILIVKHAHPEMFVRIDQGATAPQRSDK